MKNLYIKTKKHVESISRFPLFFFLFVMAYCPVTGQGGPSKPLVQPNDYDMWHDLRFSTISGDGKWISYLFDYQLAQDTLVVMDVEGKVKHEFPNAQFCQFQPQKKPIYFVFQDNKKGIGVLNLTIGKTIWDKRAERFEFSKDGRYLASYALKTQDGYLRLLDTKTKKSDLIYNVQNFKFNPAGNSAVIITGDSISSSVAMLDLDNMKKSLITRSDKSKFSFPIWNQQGNGLVFMENDKKGQHRLYYFENNWAPILKELNNFDLNFKGDLSIAELELSFSQDGERIFFWTQKHEEIKMKDPDSIKVQVWKGTDKWIYPRKKLDWEYNKRERLAVWWPISGKTFQIGNDERPEVVLTGDQKFALGYNILTYEPQNRHKPETDFYLVNIETGNTTTLLEKIPLSSEHISISPKGNMIAYFKDRNWWLYNVNQNKHSNVTEKINESLKYKHAPHSVDETPFGHMGWTTNNEFLVYDDFDIWLTTENTPPQRLTQGRESNIRYRAYNWLNQGFYPIWHSIPEDIYDLSKNIFLTSRDSLFNYGYAKREPNGTVQFILHEEGNIRELRKAKFAEAYIFTKEKNTVPPAIYKIERPQPKLLVQSNPQQLNFAIGKRELIPFQNEQGEQLYGLLHYPDNYEEGKQYPMIVHFYEIKSHEYQNYLNPSYYGYDGFNSRDLNAAGYFVFEPDVLVQKGNPGISATDCIVAGTKEVLKKGIIKPHALGIIGHSFGGYVTAFTISQTNMFSAAVVGSGVYDIVSSYHTVGQDYGRSKEYLYENQQWQMGKSFYEDRSGYYNNSPLHHGANIKTPTLIWTGNEDYHVDWHQSEAMYLGLRRQNTEVELLVYENEIHTLMDPRNRKDLTQRIHKWFDNHLLK